MQVYSLFIWYTMQISVSCAMNTQKRVRTKVPTWQTDPVQCNILLVKKYTRLTGRVKNQKWVQIIKQSPKGAEAKAIKQAQSETTKTHFFPFVFILNSSHLPVHLPICGTFSMAFIFPSIALLFLLSAFISFSLVLCDAPCDIQSKNKLAFLGRPEESLISLRAAVYTRVSEFNRQGQRERDRFH